MRIDDDLDGVVEKEEETMKLHYIQHKLRYTVKLNQYKTHLRFNEEDLIPKGKQEKVLVYKKKVEGICKEREYIFNINIYLQL